MGRIIAISMMLWLGLGVPVLAEKQVVESASRKDKEERLANDLIYKVTLGRASEVETLLREGGKADTVNPSDVPLLALAATRRDLEGVKVIKALLEAGAPIDQVDGNGQTALFYAAKNGNMDSVGYLLEKGAQYYLPDAKGDIARSFAYRQGRKDVVRFMDGFVERKSAEVNQQYEEYYRVLKEHEQRRQELQQGTWQSQYEQKQADAEAAKRAYEELVAKRTPEYLKELVQGYAQSVCLFQYWTYCAVVEHTGELHGDAAQKESDDQQARIQEVGQKLIADFGVNGKYIRSIQEPAQTFISDQLDRYDSKLTRSQAGLCTKGDALQRCQNIARGFEFDSGDAKP